MLGTHAVDLSDDDRGEVADITKPGYVRSYPYDADEEADYRLGQEKDECR